MNQEAVSMNQRTAKINLRVTPAEHRAIEIAAVGVGLTISDYVRRAALMTGRSFNAGSEGK